MRYILCEIYSRVVGYFRPVDQWNPGKQEEFKNRKAKYFKKEQNNKKKNKYAKI